MQRDNVVSELYKSIKVLIEDSRKKVARNVNVVMVYTYFQVGKLIVEKEQKGNSRAEYAKSILKNLSSKLTKDFGRGFSVDNLQSMRLFYQEFSMSKRLAPVLAHPLEKTIYETVSRISDSADILSWSHYILLLKIKDRDVRSFYEIEAIRNSWSFRELKRQYHSSLFERLAISRDKKGVMELSQKGQVINQPIDTLKNPYVLEFLSLKEDAAYTENDLESAIIEKLEHFLLELGKGFLFAGRQQRITLDNKHFHIDLVFYNRLIKCFVLFDLKIGELTHQDIGQMQMYVNYYDRKLRLPEENPTLGIILCKERNKTVVEFTLPEQNKTIFAKEYKLYLPSKEALKKQLE